MENAIIVRSKTKSDTQLPATARNVVAESGNGLQMQVQSRNIRVNGRVSKVNPLELMRLIKRFTQEIGEYKKQENLHSDYLVNALRDARANVVADLEGNFRITWKCDEATGNSIFYMM